MLRMGQMAPILSVLATRRVCDGQWLPPPDPRRTINSGRRGYRFKQADQLSCKRRHLASCLPRKMTAALWHGIEERLAQQQWSPEQIAGRLRLDGIVSVSPSWIYRHVWSDRSGGGTL